jgi:hypothetical protein
MSAYNETQRIILTFIHDAPDCDFRVHERVEVVDVGHCVCIQGEQLVLLHVECPVVDVPVQRVDQGLRVAIEVVHVRELVQDLDGGNTYES